MAQTAEALAFLDRLRAAAPNDLVSSVLAPSIEDESTLRKLFATDPNNSRLQDLHVGLIDVYGPGTDKLRLTAARDVTDPAALAREHVMPLDPKVRRQTGEPAMAPLLEDFRKSWNVFTEGSLSQLLDWNNVIAAGGSVLACLLPLPQSAQASKRAIRKYFHETGELDDSHYALNSLRTSFSIPHIRCRLVSLRLDSRTGLPFLPFFLTAM